VGGRQSPAPRQKEPQAHKKEGSRDTVWLSSSTRRAIRVTGEKTNPGGNEVSSEKKGGHAVDREERPFAAPAGARVQNQVKERGVRRASKEESAKGGGGVS